MSQVEIVDDSGQVQVAPVTEVTTIETTTPQPAVAVETPQSGSGVEVISADTVDVEVQVPPDRANALETSVATVVEVQVPMPGTVALPVQVEPPVLEVDIPGPQGVAGPQGVQGLRGVPGPAGSGANYTHHQNTAAAVWTIPHFLGFNPAVTVIDSAGTDVEGDIAYPDLDTVTVTFTAAFGGTAYLS